MAKTWTDVAASPAYQALPPDQQQAAQRQYFDANVAPRVPQADHDAAWQQFSAWKPATAADASSSSDARQLDQRLTDQATDRGQPTGPSLGNEPAREAPATNTRQADDAGLVKGLAREATQGATFEFGDEIGLGAAALAAKGAQKLGIAPDNGQSVGQIYGDMRQHYNDERRQFHDEHPVAATVANLAGSVATGGAGGAALVGKAAQAGRLAQAGVLATTGATEGAAFGAGAADPGNRLQGAAEGAALGAVAAPVGSALAGAAARTLAKRGVARQIDALVPNRDDIANAAHNLYDKADQLGVVLKPQAVAKLQNDLTAQAQGLGFNERIHPKVSAALDSFDDLAGQAPTLARIEQQRRILGAAAKSLEPDERRIASELIGHYDDAIQGLRAADVKAGNYVQAGSLLKQARGLWQRQAKLGVIDDAVERAQNQASGFENGLRTQFRSILNNPKKMRGFTPDEKIAMQTIVRGGPVENTLKFLGKFGLGEGNSTNMLGASVGAAGGAAIAGPVGAVAVPVLGQMARKAAQRATVRNVEQLQRLVAAGAHPRYIVNRYATLAGKSATPQELSQYLVTAPQTDLLDLASKLNTLKGPQRKLAGDALALTLSGKAGE